LLFKDADAYAMQLILVENTTITAGVVSALIAGIVSLIGGVLTYRASLISTRHLYKSKERELSRKMTEKLVDLRLQTYPSAFQILSKLTEKELNESDITKQECLDIRKELMDWKNQKAVFLLSENAFKSYYKLLETLAISEDKLTKKEAHNVQQAKNDLSRKLRVDVNLIFEEDA
jgi:hypothetical protein